MKRTIVPGGAIEYIPTDEEKTSKKKYKARKKASDLTDADLKELVYALAKRFNLL